MKEKRIIYLIMGVCSILILLIGITTAWFEWRSEVDTNVTFNVEGLNITYEGEPTVIKGNLYPTMYMNNTDNIIHNFSLVTTSNIEIYSKISLEIITLPTELNHESFRWNLYKDSTQIASGNFLNAEVGTDILLSSNEKITTTKSNYTLYIWIDGENYDNPLTMGGKTFEFKLKLEASQQDYATAEECFVFDESSGTITDYKAGVVSIKSYNIHPECVANAQTSVGMSEEEAITFCSGGEFQGYTIVGLISLGAGADLESAGIITNVVYSGCSTDVVIPSSINGVSVKAIGTTTLASSVSYLNKEKIIASPLVNNLNKKTKVKLLAQQSMPVGPFTNKNITSVVIPDSVTTIGLSAFSLNNLTSVVIPDSVTTIENYAFYKNKLTSVTIGNSVKTIGNWAFRENSLTSVVIPDSVTTIGEYAFQSNNLTSVVIPNSVTTIGDKAFSTNKLTSVVIPNSVTSVGAYTFQFNGLTSVVIPNSVKTIGYKAFESNKLTSVVIPDSVTTIEESAFAYNSLTSVTIGNSVTTIGRSAFSSNNLTSVVIPDSVTSIGGCVFNNNQLLENQMFIYSRTDKNKDGIAEIDYTTIVSYGGVKKDNVVIPEGVTTIGDSAFSYSNLTSVVIPDSVIIIGDYAFKSNKLTSVVIPDSVTTIGIDAFAYNDLTSVVIPDSVTTIKSNAFSYNKLSRVYIGTNSNLTETTGIDQYAFSSSNRTSTSNGTTYVDNPNLTTIYNNSGKKFKWYYVTQGRNNSTDDAYNFITGTVPLYNSYNKVTITTGGNP